MRRLKRQFGELANHVTNQLEILRNIVSPGTEWRPDKERQLELIATKLLKLNDRERQAFTLKWFEGGEILNKPKSNDFVAHGMGISYNAATKLLQHAVEKMREKG